MVMFYVDLPIKDGDVLVDLPIKNGDVLVDLPIKDGDFLVDLPIKNGDVLVDLPIKDGDVLWLCGSLPKGNYTDDKIGCGCSPFLPPVKILLGWNHPHFDSGYGKLT